jgi:hypothetical protein
MSVALTGKDTIIVDTRLLTDLGTGDVVNIDAPNNLAELKQGKNGNAIYAYNASGKIVNVTVRVIRGSPDDKYLASRMQEYINDPAKFILIGAEFTKRSGDGLGNITNEIYTMSGGIVQKMPGGKENVEGDTEQAISIYVIVFSNVDRILG